MYVYFIQYPSVRRWDIYFKFTQPVLCEMLSKQRPWSPTQDSVIKFPITEFKYQILYSLGSHWHSETKRLECLYLLTLSFLIKESIRRIQNALSTYSLPKENNKVNDEILAERLITCVQYL